MKNIHILPTDKPSRLRYFNGTLQLMYLVPKKSDITFQHIYITSDEEIKEGDWMHYKHFGEDIVTKYDTMGGQNTNVNEHKDYYKKIILTTDQDLIKDGVQAIDDTFLQWFVKNPSCEEVKVDSKLIVRQDKPLLQHQGTKPIVVPHKIEYKLIIPKEEPKTNLDRLPFPELVKEFAEYYKNIPLVEETKTSQLPGVNVNDVKPSNPQMVKENFSPQVDKQRMYSDDKTWDEIFVEVEGSLHFEMPIRVKNWLKNKFKSPVKK